MELDLVGSRDNLAVGEQAVQVLYGKVADADGFDLVGMGFVKPLHFVPGVEPVDGLVGTSFFGHGCGPVHEPYV